MEVSKRRWAPWTGGGLLLLFGVLGLLELVPGRSFVFGDDPLPVPKSLPSVPDSTQATPPAPRDPALEEILRLRRALGGATARESLDEKQFADALRKLAQNASSDADLSVTDSSPPASTASDSARTESATLPPPSLPALPIEMPTGASPSADPTVSPEFLDQHLIDTLRSVSRELDSRASDLDDQRRYDTADRLRKLARRMRIELRELESPADSSTR